MNMNKSIKLRESLRKEGLYLGVTLILIMLMARSAKAEINVHYDFNGGVPPEVELDGIASLVSDDDDVYLGLSFTGSTGSWGSAKFNALKGAVIHSSFEVSINLATGNEDGNSPADGIKFSFPSGDDTELQTGWPSAGEVGLTGAGFGFDTWPNSGEERTGEEEPGFFIWAADQVNYQPMPELNGLLSNPNSIQTSDEDGNFVFGPVTFSGQENDDGTWGFTGRYKGWELNLTTAESPWGGNPIGSPFLRTQTGGATETTSVDDVGIIINSFSDFNGNGEILLHNNAWSGKGLPLDREKDHVFDSHEFFSELLKSDSFPSTSAEELLGIFSTDFIENKDGTPHVVLLEETRKPIGGEQNNLPIVDITISEAGGSAIANLEDAKRRLNEGESSKFQRYSIAFYMLRESRLFLESIGLFSPFVPFWKSFPGYDHMEHINFAAHATVVDIVPKIPGDYQFFFATDDGFQVDINSIPVASHDPPRSTEVNNVIVKLNRGSNTFEMIFYQWRFGAVWLVFAATEPLGPNEEPRTWEELRDEYEEWEASGRHGTPPMEVFPWSWYKYAGK